MCKSKKFFLDIHKLITQIRKGDKMKLGTNTKKEISKHIKSLEKYGFKVWNFSTKHRTTSGVKDFVDFVIAGYGRIYFVELKIGADKLSEGQIRTKKILEKTKRYILLTEDVVDNFIEAVIEGVI